MNTQTLPIKRLAKQDRERQVLLHLVEFYIHTGKPVGSNTLKEAGLGDLSSATIRNYFANLEEEGYLHQAHASGGRIPTNRAFRLYAQTLLEEKERLSQSDPFASLKAFESREIAAYLQHAVEKLSKQSYCAAFMIAPRFDQDFVSTLKLVPLDTQRCLCAMVTDFGVIQTEIMHIPAKLSSFAIKRIEDYFHWRLTGLDKPENLTLEEENLAQGFYNELMLRHIVSYTHFTHEDIYRTGFSQLLNYSAFQEPSLLANGLTLFEDPHRMRLLLRECKVRDHLHYWIGEDLSLQSGQDPSCTVLAIPYYINNKAVGAVGLLGPTRIPYRDLFDLMRHFSAAVSQALTKAVYKHKIQFRENPQAITSPEQSRLMIDRS